MAAERRGAQPESRSTSCEIRNLGMARPRLERSSGSHHAAEGVFGADPEFMLLRWSINGAAEAADSPRAPRTLRVTPGFPARHLLPLRSPRENSVLKYPVQQTN